VVIEFGVANTSSIALPSPWIPNFHYAILCSRHDTKCICSESPDTFDVTKQGPNASTNCKTFGRRDCGVHGACEYVLGRTGTVGAAKISRYLVLLLRATGNRDGQDS
jgi:hypothetical protein